MMLKHLVHQGPTLRALAATGIAALRSSKGATGAKPVTPGPEVTATLPPRSPALVRDYVRHVGGDPGAYRNTLPAHMFPQWAFPLAAATLSGLPYPIVKVINAGCKLEMRAPLPAGEPIHVTARLESIDDDGRRALLHQRVVTGTASSPEALVAHLFAFVPLGCGSGARSKDRARPHVPDVAREHAFWKIKDDAGATFAALTGDVNPIHWLPPYARAAGFRATILHGFSTMARAIEGLHRARFSGDVRALASIDVRFTRPLVLPARVGLYVGDGGAVYVGDAPGGASYLEGQFTVRTAS
jgi:acyl dehydratase